MTIPPALSIYPLPGIPEIVPGDPLPDLLAQALTECTNGLHPHDILVVTSKIIAKAEGRLVALPENEPDAKKRLIFQESQRILRQRGDLFITQTQHGLICANAGIDQSNTAPDTAVLLPRDPDRSARKLRDKLAARFNTTPFGVVITDTFGRPWRKGLTDVAIGSAGFAPLLDLRGATDTAGRRLAATEIAISDEIAAAADLVKGKLHGLPAVLVRGLSLTGDGASSDLIRSPQEDLFR